MNTEHEISQLELFWRKLIIVPIYPRFNSVKFSNRMPAIYWTVVRVLLSHTVICDIYCSEYAENRLCLH